MRPGRYHERIAVGNKWFGDEFLFGPGGFEDHQGYYAVFREATFSKARASETTIKSNTTYHKASWPSTQGSSYSVRTNRPRGAAGY